MRKTSLHVNHMVIEDPDYLPRGEGSHPAHIDEQSIDFISLSHGTLGNLPTQRRFLFLHKETSHNGLMPWNVLVEQAGTYAISETAVVEVVDQHYVRYTEAKNGRLRTIIKTYRREQLTLSQAILVQTL